MSRLYSCMMLSLVWFSSSDNFHSGILLLDIRIIASLVEDKVSQISSFALIFREHRHLSVFD
uniref:Uncharacterized protein n=1 Tax=Lepeophtheirus salmonis TaxID=72036 RepID=A0A0K2VC63_LEPSM